MVSDPPADPPSGGWTPGDIGHGLLDVAGLIPIVGEPADLANAAWYAAEGQHLEAGLSLISMIPVVGDAIGKGGKILKRAGGKMAPGALDAIRSMDFAKTLGRFRSHPTLGPHIDRIIKALEDWRTDLVGKLPDASPGQVTESCAKGLAVPSTIVSKTRVPDSILAKLTSAERAVFEKAVAEVETTPLRARPDKAVFYSGKSGGDWAWKKAEEAARSGAFDSVNTLSGNLLNRPEIRDVLPRDAMAFLDDMASEKLARGASGVVNVIGDLDTISATSVFRRIELPALLENPGIAADSRAALSDMKHFLDAKYGP